MHVYLLGLRGVPDARLSTEVKTLEWLASGNGVETVDEFRTQLLPTLEGWGIDPEELWAFSDDLPYNIDIIWSLVAGCYDVVLQRRDTPPPCPLPVNREREAVECLRQQSP